MRRIDSCELPAEALLARYAQRGAYTDCYATDFAGSVSQAEYLTAFYTSRVFKLERVILKLVIGKPSTDAQARQLALGAISRFAAWTVEDRNPQQLLMRDYLGRTCSWLMLAPLAGGQGTRLYFGSAVVPLRPAGKGKPAMGWMFHALLGFHRLYSRLLLRSACAGLQARRQFPPLPAGEGQG